MVRVMVPVVGFISARGSPKEECQTCDPSKATPFGETYGDENDLSTAPVAASSW
jgi:hypothetical protein